METPTIGDTTILTKLIDWLKESIKSMPPKTILPLKTTKQYQRFLDKEPWPKNQWKPQPVHLAILIALLGKTLKDKTEISPMLEILLLVMQMPEPIHKYIEVDLRAATYRLTLRPDQIKIIGEKETR